MNRLYAASLCLLLAAGCEGSGGGGEGPVDAVFVSGGTLLVGDGSSIEKATMIIENGVVKQVGKEKELYAPKGSLQIDAEGRTVLPLMINLNAYPGLNNANEFGAKVYERSSLMADLNRYEYYGVNAVVAGGDSDGLAFQLREEQHSGTTPGATLHTSGRGIAAKGSSGVLGDIPLLVSTAAEAREAVGELGDRKADAIVLWAHGMRADAAAAVVDESHKRNLKVFADAPDLSEAKNLANAGVDALVSSVTDKEVDDELISMLKQKNIPLAPALTSLQAKFIYADAPRWLGERAMSEVYPPGLSAYLKDTVVVNSLKRDSQLNTYRQHYENATKNLKKLADSGVTIAFGSGSGLPKTFPGYFEHRELELMVNAGLSPADVIKAATSSSAAALGASDLGTLSAGKKANFMIVGGNPLEDIVTTKLVDEVYVEGKKVDRLDLTTRIVVKIPQVTQAQRANEAAIQQKERENAEDAGQTRYGKYVLGPSVQLGPGLIVQTPKRSKAAKAGGPPYKLTVSYPGESGNDLRGFYAAVFSRGWTSSGGCWEKPNPSAEGKKFRACAEPASGQIVLNITVQ